MTGIHVLFNFLVQIYDLDEFKVVHDSRYQHPLLSFAAAPNGRCYAVGMANGVVICRDNKHKQIGESPQPFLSQFPNSSRRQIHL